MKGKVVVNMERVDLVVEVLCYRVVVGKSEFGREFGKCILFYLLDFDDGCYCKRKFYVYKLLLIILIDLILFN